MSSPMNLSSGKSIHLLLSIGCRGAFQEAKISVYPSLENPSFFFDSILKETRNSCVHTSMSISCKVLRAQQLILRFRRAEAESQLADALNNTALTDSTDQSSQEPIGSGFAADDGASWLGLQTEFIEFFIFVHLYRRTCHLGRRSPEALLFLFLPAISLP